MRASILAATVLLLPACGGGTASSELPASMNIPSSPSSSASQSPLSNSSTNVIPTPGASAKGTLISSPSVSSTANPAPKPTQLLTPVSWIWGVTTDDPTVNTAQQVDALRSFQKRVTVRTVFNMPSGGGPVATDYSPSIAAIAQVADVMGLINDSSTMASTSLATIQDRIAEYLSVLGNSVKIWEVGNEVNGNWLGNGVVPKIEAAYDAVKAAGKTTALTLYYENPPTPGYDMIPWVDANIPVGNRMRTGLDYVFVSYYEDQNGGHQLTQPELDGMFSALAARFPNAKLGFGECGWGITIPAIGGGDAVRAALLQRFYSYRVPSVTAFVGGNFYWHFRQTMTPKTLPDWGILNALIQ